MDMPDYFCASAFKVCFKSKKELGERCKMILSEKGQANMKSCLQPLPKVLVSCRGINGEDND